MPLLTGIFTLWYDAGEFSQSMNDYVHLLCFCLLIAVYTALLHPFTTFCIEVLLVMDFFSNACPLLQYYCFLRWQHWYWWEPSERWASSHHGSATCHPKPGRPSGWPAKPGPWPSSQCAPGLLHADGCSGPSGRGPGQLGELQHMHTHKYIQYRTLEMCINACIFSL